MNQVSLLITPVDVSLFREPRPFEAGATGLRSQLPTPATLAGAVRVWLLEGQEARQALRSLSREVRTRDRTEVANGPHPGSSARSIKPALQSLLAGHPAAWVVEAHLRGPILYGSDHTGRYPAPLHLVARQDQEHTEQARLFPLMPLDMRLPGVALPSGAPDSFRACWFGAPSDLLAQSGYVLFGAMEEGLSATPNLRRREVWSEDRLFALEARLGIGMNSDRNTTREGMLYSVAFMRLREQLSDEVGFGFRVDLQSEVDIAPIVQRICQHRPWLKLGGEGKVAGIRMLDTTEAEPLPSTLAPWPPSSGRFSTYLATPGLFDKPGWFPQQLAARCNLISAVVGDPLIYSGWDSVYRRPLPTRQAVRAGAIYFWQQKEGADLCQLSDPHGTTLSDHAEDSQAGWGLCLRGDWNYV